MIKRFIFWYMKKHRHIEIDGYHIMCMVDTTYKTGKIAFDQYCSKREEFLHKVRAQLDKNRGADNA